MNRKKICFLFIGIILCVWMVNPLVYAKEKEGNKVYKIENFTVSFPNKWNVMYEENEDLQRIYTMYHLDSYEKWKQYMGDYIFEAISTNDVDLTSQYGALDNEEAISIFLIDYTNKFQPDFLELKELPEKEKTEFLDKFKNSMLAESHMKYIDSYIVNGDTLDFVVVELKIEKYQYTVAGTVTGGKVYTMMATSQDPKSVLAEKKEIFQNVMKSFSVEPTSIAETEEVPVKEDAISKSYNLTTGLFIILILAILLWNAKAKRGKEFYEDAFCLDKTKGLQGFCAIGIMLHHMAQIITQNNQLDKGFLNLFCDIGVVFVGIFFFCSGFGLYTSFRNKPNYINGFLRKRLSAILIPFYVGNTIFVVTTILFGAKYKPSELISAFTGWVLMNTQLWYIVDIFILYIVFYFLFRFIKKESVAFWFMGIFVVGFMTFSLLLGHDTNTISGGAWLKGEWWYNGIFVFFVGMTFARYYPFLVNMIQKSYWICLAIGICGSSVFYALTEIMLKTKGYWSETENYAGYLEKVQTLSCQLPMIIFIVITFLLITMKVQFKNKALTFLGKISLELYIIHNLFLTYLRGAFLIENDFLFILSVYVMSISMAVLLHVLDHKLIQIISGENNNNKLGEGKTRGKSEHLIDCMRLLMAFLVVCIHYPFEGKIGQIIFCFGKVAVPFFLVVSGYFCYSGDSDCFIGRIKKQAGRIFMISAGAGFLYGYLYLIGNKLGFIDAKIQTLITEKSLIHLLVYNESPVAPHLWFLGSLFYALILMLIVTKLNIDKYVMYISPILIGIYVYLSYVGKAEYYVIRNALLVTWPYFMMGCMIKRYKDQIQSHIKPFWVNVSAVVCMVLVIVEYNIRHSTSLPYISTEILVYLVVLVCLNYPEVGKGTIINWLGSKCTLFVYITHIFVLWFFWYGVFGLKNVNPVIITLSAFFVPLLVCAGIEMYKKRSGLVEKKQFLNKA